jgi:hypothetical protein
MFYCFGVRLGLDGRFTMRTLLKRFAEAIKIGRLQTNARAIHLARTNANIPSVWQHI